MYSRVNSELPEHIRSVLPVAAQTYFRLAASDAIAKGLDEKRATHQAWHLVKQLWEKPKKGGVWIRKSIEGKLHIDRFLEEDEEEEEKKKLEKAAPRTLYICRHVKNGKDIVKWAKSQGFQTTTEPDDLHTTIIYSKRAVDWMKVPTTWSAPDGKDEVTVHEGGARLVEPLGDKGAVVLLFTNDQLKWRHEAIQREAGTSWDFDGFQPHVTITWDKGDLDLSKVEPYRGKIVLGPEIFKEINEDWKDNHVEKADYDAMVKKFQSDIDQVDVEIIKVDPNLGLVFGWAIICKRDGADYFDLNIDRSSGEKVPEHITEKAMLEAAVDFMHDFRLAKEMHEGDGVGTVPFAFPLTSDVAEAMGIKTKHTGLMIAMRPSKEVLKKFMDGTYRGFSIGGSRQKVEDIAA